MTRKKIRYLSNNMRNSLPDLDIKLKQIRAEKSWAQEDLAREIGVSLSTVQRWEKKGAKPNRLAQKVLIKLIKTTDSMHHMHQHSDTTKPILRMTKKRRVYDKGKKTHHE
jgi:DNA-binding transcriptional regulator YiaG